MVQERTVDSSIAWLPRTHGSAIFTRGETQAMVTVTLGTKRDAQLIDSMEGTTRDSFLFHYNFPPYCVGETRLNSARPDCDLASSTNCCRDFLE